jgi:hypothetical protein
MVLVLTAFGIFHGVPSHRHPQLVQNSLPADANPTCTVAPGNFATWFAGGSAAANGLVNPANSLGFSPSSNCSFYQWSEQMFLWVTSPTSGELVLNTPTFFGVSPLTTSGIRNFIPQPVAAGVINVEQSQADSSVLESTEGNSLVYYMTTVNDVYALLDTGVKVSGLVPPQTQFPTTAGNLSAIETFAATHGVTFPDANALAVVIKSAWVLASSLPDPGDYVTTMANVPTYNQTNPGQWVQNGSQTVQLALVGMHVVGSVAGHPELIWATFEHMNNMPRAEYQYINNALNTITVDEDATASWVFTSANSTGPFNCQHMSFAAGDINAVSPSTPCAPNTVVSPSDTVRWKPFGAAQNVTPNPGDASPAASNTEIISINNSIQSMLPGPDVRNNYVLTGATWTEGGAAPTGIFPHGNEVGTSVLANGTAETYEQGVNNQLSFSTMGFPNDGTTTCFSCHLTNGLNVSHDFGPLQQLTSFTPNPGYTLGGFPGHLFLTPGGFATAQISVLPFNNFSGEVMLSASGLPKGVKASFNPKSTSSTSTLTLTSESTTTESSIATVIVTAKSGKLTNSTTFSLMVNAPGFALTPAPDEVSVDDGNTTTSTITVTPLNGFSGSVTLSAKGLPKGVKASFSPNPATTTSTLTLTATEKTEQTTATVTITGKSGKVEGTADLGVTVGPPQ